MMEQWEIVAMSDVCIKIQDGAHHSPKKLYDGPGKAIFPYLTSKNIRTGYLKLDTVQYCDEEFHNSIYPRCNPENGDILLTKDGANTGNVAINNLDEPFSLLSSVCLLKPDPSLIVSSYLFYYLQSPGGFSQITGKMTGAAIKRIILKTIKSSRIPLTSIAKQKQIVAKLDQAFANIEKAKANAEQNLVNAKELFDSYLDSFSQEKKALGDFVEIKTGKLNSNAAKENGKYPFFTCSREIFAIDEYAFDCESILLAGNNASGDFNVKHYNGKFNAYQRTYVITIKDLQVLNYGFLYYQMVKSLKELKSSSVGAGTKFLKLGMIKDLKISIPDIDVQNKALSKLSQLEKNVKSLEVVYQKKINALDELKQSILQKAFNGELA